MVITTPLINNMSRLEIFLYIALGVIVVIVTIKTIIKAKKVKRLKQEGKEHLANDDVAEQEKDA